MMAALPNWRLVNVEALEIESSRVIPSTSNFSFTKCQKLIFKMIAHSYYNNNNKKKMAEKKIIFYLFIFLTSFVIRKVVSRPKKYFNSMTSHA